MASDYKPALKPASSEAQAELTPRFVKSADYRLHYCNHARIGLSVYDVRFHVGHQLDVTSDPAEVEESAMIVMSPVQAKTVVVMLARAVAQYEKAFGTIQTAPVTDAKGKPIVAEPTVSEEPAKARTASSIPEKRVRRARSSRDTK